MLNIHVNFVLQSTPRMHTMHAFACVLIACAATTCCAFYIPGVAPTEFNTNDPVDIKVVKLSSVNNPMPYEYYYLPFCRPDKIIRRHENLGEVLRGDRIMNTNYKIDFLKDVHCKMLCKENGTYSSFAYNKNQVQLLTKFIKNEYRIQFLVDNLPAATKYVTDLGEEKLQLGIPIGYVENNDVYLYNHVVFTVKHYPSSYGYRIVGLEVTPLSLDLSHYHNTEVYKDMACVINTEPSKATALKLDANNLKDGKLNVIYSYTTRFESCDVAWASRWDVYLAMNNSEIHWFAILNSLIIVMFLAGAVAAILIRTLRHDIAMYNNEDEEDIEERSGWKLIHGDVLRPPQHASLLAILCGSGIQLLLMTSWTIAFAMLGMLSPASRGALTTMAIVMYMLMGAVGGYYGARLYRTMNGETWKHVAWGTALFFPSVVFSIAFILNFFIWGEKSSGAVPFTTMLALAAMWLGVSVPLVIAGSYFGFRKGKYELSLKVNLIPRPIPPQKWFSQLHVRVLLGGIVPFGAVFIEFFFIFNAIWQNQFYYLFGILFLVLVVFAVACAEMSIVASYLQLCNEDHRWWWPSFLSSGGVSIYVLLYAVYYFIAKLHMNEFVPALLYFGYSLIMAFAFFILSGTIGFYTSLLFIQKIYSSVKLD